MENYNKFNEYIVDEKKSSSLLARSFLFFGIELVLTGLLTYLFSYLFTYILPIDIDRNATIYLILTVVASIGVLILSFTISKNTLVKNKVPVISTILFVAFMSLLLSSLTIYIDYRLLVSAVALTSGLFLIMAIFALIFKGKGRWLIGIALALVISLAALYLVNTFLLIPMLVTGSSSLTNAYMQIYFLSEAIILVYACVVTIIDVKRIKESSASEENINALALYHSINLYSDFILILVKVLSILLREKSKN